MEQFKVFFEVEVSAPSPVDAALMGWKQVVDEETVPVTRVKLLTAPGTRGVGTRVDLDLVLESMDPEWAS